MTDCNLKTLILLGRRRASLEESIFSVAEAESRVSPSDARLRRQIVSAKRGRNEERCESTGIVYRGTIPEGKVFDIQIGVACDREKKRTKLSLKEREREVKGLSMGLSSLEEVIGRSTRPKYNSKSND